MRSLVAQHLSELVPYVPGKPIEETEREYGVTNIAKLASNENCLGPSPLALQAIAQHLKTVHLYPDSSGFYLRQRIAQLHGHGVQASQVVLGNGTNELIVLIARAFLGEGEALLNAWPSFVCYRIAARSLGRRELTVPLTVDKGYDLEKMADAARVDGGVKLVFLANPNNPTGRHFDSAALDAFLRQIPPDVIVVLDEAYAEYVHDAAYPNGTAVVQRRPRTVVLRTFSKVYGLASLRIGYAVCDPEIADVLNKMRDAFNTSGLAQAAALAALDDSAHVERSKSHNARALPRLTALLEERGFEVTPSQGNFVLASLPVPVPASSGAQALPSVPELNEALLHRGVILRPVLNYGLSRSLRISVGTDAELDKLQAALDDIAHSGKRSVHPPIIVALDGPAGAGKSTVARLVAARAGLSLVDTGAIYRSVALLALRRGISVDDGAALGQVARELATSLTFQIHDGQNRTHVAGEDVTEAIRTPEVSAVASSVSRHPDVRAALLDLQRMLGRRGRGAVLEGRDIGTVVFPNADVKCFVTASAEERAKRRMKELAERGVQATFEQVLKDIEHRDKQDSERAVAPLRAAADAVVVDTSGKPLDAVVNEIAALVDKALVSPARSTPPAPAP